MHAEADEFDGSWDNRECDVIVILVYQPVSASMLLLYLTQSNVVVCLVLVV